MPMINLWIILQKLNLNYKINSIESKQLFIYLFKNKLGTD